MDFSKIEVNLTILIEIKDVSPKDAFSNSPRTDINLSKETTKQKGFTELSKKGDLQRAVKNVFRDNPQKTWSTRAVVTELKSLNLKPMAKKAGLAVNAVCKRLLKQGFIEQTVTASGRSPAEYKFKQSDPTYVTG